jgi:hypothetical protein
MSIFEKKFVTLLEQPVAGPPVEGVPATPEDMTAPPAAEPTTDADTAGALDQGATPNNPAINYKREQKTQMTGSIQQWITQIQEFNEFLNGLNSNSMQAQLNNADCDTLFADVSRSETKKISRIAQDLSALTESFKGYLLSAEDNTQQ